MSKKIFDMGKNIYKAKEEIIPLKISETDSKFIRLMEDFRQSLIKATGLRDKNGVLS